MIALVTQRTVILATKRERSLVHVHYKVNTI